MKTGNGQGNELGVQTQNATHLIPKSLGIKVLKRGSSQEYILESDRRKIINWLREEQTKGIINGFYEIKKENFNIGQGMVEYVIHESKKSGLYKKPIPNNQDAVGMGLPGLGGPFLERLLLNVFSPRRQTDQMVR